MQLTKLKKRILTKTNDILIRKYKHRIIVDNFSIKPPINNFSSDFVRVGTLELIAREIKECNKSGNCAEVGVYQGDFAKYINFFFPEKTLYLFDTFSGFDERDLVNENDNVRKNKSSGFKDTNIDIVMNKMHNPQKVKIRKGYFPDTTEGLEDKFVFVSLDADLYEPTLAGLEYFYPRMEWGGYIMIHDYNGKSFDGIKRAVREFSSKYGVPYLPLTDMCGSCIFIKQ